MAKTPFLAQAIIRLARARVGRSRRNNAARGRRPRPGFDRLEERTLLSTWTVTDNSDNPTDTGSLRYAIQSEPSGTMITFAPSVTGPISLSPVLGTLVLSNTKTAEAIAGPGASIVTISGGDQVGVFHVLAGATATLTGLTIAHGNASVVGGSGGGILNEDGTLTVSNCTVSNNLAYFGGGIRNLGTTSTMTLINTTVTQNSTFVPDNVNGSHGPGSGIDNALGTLTIVNSTVSNNIGGSSGGGVSNLGTLTITNSTLSGNAAVQGGGINNQGMLTVSNSTISGNNVVNHGGGIFNGANAVLTNCTISANSANQGGGVCFQPSRSPSTMAVSNTIIAGNTLSGNDASGPDVLGVNNNPFGSLGYNLIGNTTGSTGWASTDLLNVNPLLGSLANNGGPTQTMALMVGSPALGAGIVAFITNPPFAGPPFTDQRGLPRIKNGTVDIGAFETQ
jgi:hypothetical protein